MIQINPLQSYIDGGARAALTTPPSASLVFDLPGKAIWVKGVKLKGIDHTYTFSHDNYITLTNTPDKNNPESEDINIGVNITTLKNAIDTTYNGGTLALLQEGLNTEERTWQAKILHSYINNILPTTKNLQINGTNYAIYTTEDSLPQFFAPVSLGTTGQILACTSSGLSWINQIQNTDYRVSQSSATNDNDYRIILKQEADNNPETNFVRFSEYLTFNPSTKTLKINNIKVVTATDIYVGSTTNATAGLVPAATSEQQNYYLRGDGTWVNIATEMAAANTWRPIKVGNTDALGSSTDTGTLSFTAGTGITLAWDATNKRIIITNSSPDQNHNTDETVRQVPKTDNVNRPLMMINGSTSAGEQINTSMFSTGIYANANTKMITANGFIKAGSSDDYVLLGGGSHKALGDFSMSHSHPYLYWAGSTADAVAMGWGTLTAANGYTILSHASSSDGGDVGFTSKNGQIFMQLDGYYYQNEGRYRVLDTSDFTAFSNIGSQTTRITIGGITKDLKIDADTVDNLHSSDFLRYVITNYGDSINSSDKIDTNLTAGIHRIHISNVEYSYILTGYDYHGSYWQLYFHPTSDYTQDIKYRATNCTNWKTLLDSNNYITYTVKKDGTGASGTWDININGNADTVDGYHASNLVKFYLSPMTSGAPADSAKSWFVDTMPSASGAIVYNVPGAEKTIIAGKSTGPHGHMLQLNYDDNYLRILRYRGGSWMSTDWEKISAGYADSAGNADTVDGYHATQGNNKPWGTIPVIHPNGWMDVGNQFEFHYDNTTGSDYSTVLRCTGNYLNIVDLPSTNGTLALLTDNVASATKLQTTRTLWGQPFDGTGNVDGSLHIYSTGSSYNEGIRMHQASNGWCGVVLCGSTNTGMEGTSTDTWGIWNHGSGNLRISRGSTSDNIKSLEWGDYLTINNIDHRINVNAYPDNLGQAALLVNVSQATNTKWTRVASFHYPNARENDIVLITVGRDIIQNTPHGNLAYFGFGYVASGSASNFITLGFQGYDDLLTVLRSGNVGIGTKSPSHKLHVVGDVFSTTGFKKEGSSDDYVLLGGGGHRLFSDMAAGVHSHSYITIPECSILDENSDVFRVEWKGGDNSVATKPSGVDAFGVIKLRIARTWYAQILIAANTASGIYYRKATGNLTSSVSWIKLLDSTHQFWGQSFNGTNSISGDLSGVGWIYRANASAVNTDVYGNLKFRQLNSQASCWWQVTLANDIAVLAVHNNGNVGIGTTTPSYKLEVIGDIATSTHMYSNSSQCSWLDGQKNTSAALNISNAINTYSYWPWFRQTNTYSSKWFSVGTLNTSLYFIGSATSRTDNGYDYGFIMDFNNGNFHSPSNIYATHFYENSDIRYKEILNNLTITINIIANLPLFDFKWKENNVIGTGTSAQAVQQILPNIVSGTDKLTLDYGVLGTIAGITACKELVTQKSELQELKEKVKQLEDKLCKYENTL